MSTTFLLKRGRPGDRGKRHAHLARYDQFGNINGSWCGYLGYDISSNVPWGAKQCKHCLRRYGVAADTNG